jgi:hypothetical protein
MQQIRRVCLSAKAPGATRRKRLVLQEMNQKFGGLTSLLASGASDRRQAADGGRRANQQ